MIERDPKETAKTEGNLPLPLPDRHPYNREEQQEEQQQATSADRQPSPEVDRRAAYSVHLYAMFEELQDEHDELDLQRKQLGVGMTFFPHPLGPVLSTAAVGLLAAAALAVVAGNLSWILAPDRDITGAAALVGAPGALAAVVSRSTAVSRRQIIAAPLRARLLSFAAALTTLSAAVTIPLIRTLEPQGAQSSTEAEWALRALWLATAIVAALTMYTFVDVWRSALLLYRHRRAR